jgi:hypothetical protein
MSKELDYINERIERLEFHIAHPNEYNITPTIKVKINNGAVYKEEVATLKRIKQQLESIDNAKPSEALELIGYLKDHHMNAVPYYNWLDEIEKYILKAQEQEKVLEVIKPYLRLVNNYLQVKAIFYDDLWMTVKEIEDEEELDLLKKILGQTQI